jgi:hypothetical protein
MISPESKSFECDFAPPCPETGTLIKDFDELKPAASIPADNPGNTPPVQAFACRDFVP